MRITRTISALSSIAADLASVNSSEAREQVVAVYNRLKYHRPWCFHRDRATGIVYAAKWSPLAHCYRFLFTTTTTTEEQQRIRQAHHRTEPLFS